MDSNEIRLIKPEEMFALVEHYNDPWLGNLLEGYKYLCKNEDGLWTAADNTDGECYVEEFDREEKARYWLEEECSKQEAEDHFNPPPPPSEDGCKDYDVECSMLVTRRVLVRARSKEEAEAIVDAAWTDGDIELEVCEDETSNEVNVVQALGEKWFEKVGDVVSYYRQGGGDKKWEHVWMSDKKKEADNEAKA